MANTTTAFDSNAFMETTQKGQLDTSYVLPPEADYRAQSTDKLGMRTGIVGDGKQRAGEPWATLDLEWELLDDNLKRDLNMDRIVVRQSLMLDLAAGSTADRPILDLGVNKNMRLKRLLEATGLNKQKQWTFPQLKHQTATVRVEHRRPEGFDDDIAEVTRVSSYNGHG